MKPNSFLHQNVGEIVAADFSTAKVFKQFGIDFCCHGDTHVGTACQQLGLHPEAVEQALLQIPKVAQAQAIPFETWPLDLLIDYVLKIHHRGIRRKGPELLSLIETVKEAHEVHHPELNELLELFTFSLDDLESHLQKEENVLFPYLLELFNAAENRQTISPMHCGTIQNPIRMMRREHANEGERYFQIKALTQDFKCPADGCPTYRLMLEELETFVDNLFEHIHIENNILFPRFVEIEPLYVKHA